MTMRLAAAVSLGLLASATLALAAVGVGGSGRSQATPEGKIAYILSAHRAVQITDFRGRVLRTISLPRGRYVRSGVQFNTQGTRIWFISGSGTVARERLWLHVVPTARARGRSHPLLPGGVAALDRLSVSRDEQRVAFGVVPTRRQACGSLAIVSATGKLVRRIEASPGVELLASGWSPDSTRLLYTRAVWGAVCRRLSVSTSLMVAGGRGAGPDKRLVMQRYGLPGPTVWSPDGRRFAFIQANQRGDPSRMALVVADGRTGRGNRILASDSFYSVLAWSTARGEIIGLRVPPNRGIWAFDPDSARQRLVAEGGSEILAASATGSRVVAYHLPTTSRGIVDVTSGSFWRFPPQVQNRLRAGVAAYFVG